MLIAKAKTENAKEIFRRALSASEPVIFSTDTIYGIGAPVSDIAANQKIYDIKGRESGKPFPVLVASLEQAGSLADITTQQKELLEKIWPDTVTVILKAKEGLHPLFTLNGNIALRMPSKKWLCELIEETGALSATSANLSGKPFINDTKTLTETFAESVLFYIFDDAQSLASSTIIDITNEQPFIIREGENISKVKNLLK